MADRSAIEWTEATWNPVTGCSKVSPGCAHCYAETFAERRRGIPKPPLRAGLRPQALASAPRAAAQVAPAPRDLRELDERPLPRRHPRRVHSRRLRGDDLALQATERRPRLAPREHRAIAIVRRQRRR